MTRAGAGRRWGLLGAVLAIPLLAGPAGAQQASVQAGGELAVKTVRQIEALLAEKAQRTPAQRKVSSQLLSARQDQQYSVARRQAAVEVAADETVMVDILADVTPEVLARIRSLGGTVINSVPKYRGIRARLPLAAVEPLAGLDAVQSIHPADQAVTRKDDTSEGDVAHRANSARTIHSVDGTGIGIGVLSNGVDTLSARQSSDDLPDRVTVLPRQEGQGSEGTAMLEIVHDLAPGADLYFATASGGGEPLLASNIEALCEAGADVIVDDVYFPREAAFQDGIVAQAVNAAVADGCVVISAGGNGGNKNDGTSGVWEGDYAAGSSLPVNGVSVGVLHDFGGGVVKNRIAQDSPFAYVLQWADPLGASTNDYDLFLVDADDNVLASSTDSQNGRQDPVEIIFSIGDNHANARLLIVKTAGAADRYLRLDANAGRLATSTAGNLFGHSAAGNAITVAAVDVRAARRAGGVFNGTESVRRSNSDGPRRIFFEADGTAITPGNFSSYWRAGVAETGPGRRNLCVDLDARLFEVLRHLGGGAARGSHRGVDAGGGGRSRQRDAGESSHGDDRICARYRSNRGRSRFRRRHRDGARRGRCGGCPRGGPQRSADGGGWHAAKPDADRGRRSRDGRRGELFFRSG